MTGHTRKVRWLFAACVFVFSAVLYATEVDLRTVACPLDGTPSKTHVALGGNVAGGRDSDGCTYSSGGQWREWAIATCPKDLFSLLSDDFGAPRDAATLGKLRGEDQQVLLLYPDPDKIASWDRYAIAARFYRILGKDDFFIGNLLLTASWLARDQAVGVYPDVDGPSAAWSLLDAGARELAKSLPLADRKKVTYNLARLAERFGDPVLRDHYLDAFEALGSLDEAERAAVARFRLATHQTEPHFQDLAIEEFRHTVDRADAATSQRQRATFLLADLYRRRGHPAEAAPLFESVANDDSAPADLRDLASYLAGVVRR
jgi:hypothetical protein